MDVDRCPICGKIDLGPHIDIEYETDEELASYLEICGEVDVSSGKIVIYTKVPEGQGTDSKFGAIWEPLMDAVEEALGPTWAADLEDH